jgi:hypothetical protein
MLQDLDATLAALIDAELPAGNVTISFAAPDDQFPPPHVTLPALSLFLYDVRENRELRSGQWELERTNGSFTRTPPPVRVECSYLITAWPSPSVLDPSEEEHGLLGDVMKVLLRYPVIPDRYLRGELVGQEPPMPARIIADTQLHSLGELWQAMGGKPKAALHYAVTVGVTLFGPSDAGPAVTSKIIKISTGP